VKGYRQLPQLLVALEKAPPTSPACSTCTKPSQPDPTNVHAPAGHSPKFHDERDNLRSARRRDSLVMDARSQGHRLTLPVGVWVAYSALLGAVSSWGHLPARLRCDGERARR
jgi:hypothetical protein